MLQILLQGQVGVQIWGLAAWLVRQVSTVLYCQMGRCVNGVSPIVGRGFLAHCCRWYECLLVGVRAPHCGGQTACYVFK
jgi:hypothetical protein